MLRPTAYLWMSKLAPFAVRLEIVIPECYLSVLYSTQRWLSLSCRHFPTAYQSIPTSELEASRQE
jgi:hypothetical protein